MRGLSCKAYTKRFVQSSPGLGAQDLRASTIARRATTAAARQSARPRCTKSGRGRYRAGQTMARAPSGPGFQTTVSGQPRAPRSAGPCGLVRRKGCLRVEVDAIDGVVRAGPSGVRRPASPRQPAANLRRSGSCRPCSVIGAQRPGGEVGVQRGAESARARSPVLLAVNRSSSCQGVSVTWSSQRKAKGQRARVASDSVSTSVAVGCVACAFRTGAASARAGFWQSRGAPGATHGKLRKHDGHAAAHRLPAVQRRQAG